MLCIHMEPKQVKIVKSMVQICQYLQGGCMIGRFEGVIC